VTAGLLSAAGAAVLAIGSLSAGAAAAPNPGPGNGPQSANVPYVAWVGEHVRLVACDPSINSTLQFANYSVEDWSGYQFQPPTPDGDAGNNIGQIFDPGPSAFFTSSDPAHVVGDSEEQEGCVATDYKSLNPGLTRIKLDVRNQETNAIVYSHQFLVIWLTVNKPTLSEASQSGSGSETFQSQLSGEGQSNLSAFLGDPSGNGELAPSPFEPRTAPKQQKGLIQIRVTGSFPVVKESPLSNLLSEETYTLPEAWPTLAGILASSTEETEPPGTNPGLWDIHGSPSNGNGNAATTEGPLKADYFRGAFGNFTSGESATVGPYDPQAAEETLLSNGELNADDAPMPAMRIDVKLAKNEGGSDLGGVGSIEGASKAVLYSHNFNGNAEEEGNLYSPYYGAYIPATDRPVNEASGITGSSPGGDFPGFLNKHPDPYTFWTSVLNREQRGEGSPTGCLRRAPGRSTDASPDDDYFTPGETFLTQTFYTDERGEAYVVYTPEDGFYLERLGLTTDANEGCDLSSLFEKEIGHATINARAIYPYEPVDYQPQTSESLTKVVKSFWKKETYEFPKGTNPGDENIRIVVAKAQDIDGNPMVGEEVCFNATANSGLAGFDGHITDTEGVLFGNPGETVYLSGSYVLDPQDEGSNHLCETTNSRGLAAIEVTNSSEVEVDVTTHFENEGITRDHLFPFTGNAAGKAKEIKEAEEKKKHEEEAAATKQRHEEEEAAAKKKHEEEEASAAQKRAEEEAAENKRREEQAKAEKEKHEQELAQAKTEAEKEELAKKFKEAEEAASKAREEQALAEKRAHEKEAEAEKRQHEKEVEAETKKHEEEERAAAAAKAAAVTLVSTAPGPGLGTGSGNAAGGVAGFTASKATAHTAAKHKHKKHKKHKHKKKK
jgi:hypothetical protein